VKLDGRAPRKSGHFYAVTCMSALGQQQNLLRTVAATARERDL